MKYEFSDDSALLLGSAKRFFREGRILEMGSGTGEITLKLASEHPESTFLAAELDEESAREAAKRLSQLENARCIQTNLFLAISPEEKFDMILFNPPYLPDDPEFRDKALHGGRKGNELTIEFLGQAFQRLNSTGILLFIASTLSYPEEIEFRMQKLSLVFDIVGTKSLFFEKLLVYRAQKAKQNEKNYKQ
jgi:release factor glutamine methyltransferase